MPRFVLLHHQCPPHFKPSHWDLMLESDRVLWTWELPQLPAPWSTALQLPGSESPTVGATRLSDHRLAYLDLEGPLTGDRGEVAQVDAGTFAIVQQSAEKLVLDLQGAHLAGRVELVPDSPPNGWLLQTAS